MISLIGTLLCLVGVGTVLVVRKSKKNPPPYEVSDDESSQDDLDGFGDFEIGSQSSSNSEESGTAGSRNWGQTLTGLGWRTNSVPESPSVGSGESSTMSGGNNSIADTLSETFSGLSELAEETIFPVTRRNSRRNGNRDNRKKSGDQYDSCKKQYHYRSGNDGSISIEISASSESGESSRGNISVSSRASSRADSYASEGDDSVWSEQHSQGSSV